MTELYQDVSELLAFGQTTGELGFAQLAARAIALYLATLVVIRLGRQRLFGDGLAFDIMLGFLLGTLLYRAVAGSDTLLQTLVAAGVMLLVHGVVSVLTATPAQAAPEPTRALAPARSEEPSSVAQHALARRSVTGADPLPPTCCRCRCH